MRRRTCLGPSGSGDPGGQGGPRGPVGKVVRSSGGQVVRWSGRQVVRVVRVVSLDDMIIEKN